MFREAVCALELWTGDILPKLYFTPRRKYLPSVMLILSSTKFALAEWLNAFHCAKMSLIWAMRVKAPIFLLISAFQMKLG